MGVRIVLNYYKDIQVVNIPISLAAGLVGSVEGMFLKSFVISFLTAGFLAGVYFFNSTKKAQYYFYYNKGLSKTKLILYTYLINVLIVTLLLSIIMLLH